MTTPTTRTAQLTLLESRLRELLAVCERRNGGEWFAYITGTAGNSVHVVGDSSFQVCRGVDGNDAAFIAAASVHFEASVRASLVAIELCRFITEKDAEALLELKAAGLPCERSDFPSLASIDGRIDQLLATWAHIL